MQYILVVPGPTEVVGYFKLRFYVLDVFSFVFISVYSIYWICSFCVHISVQYILVVPGPTEGNYIMQVVG